ncbi:MAG: aquaporin [Myxococcaceae bacterium]
MLDSLRRHWPEYLIEAGLLAVLLLAAGSYALLLAFPAAGVLPEPMLHRLVFGVLMGLTVIAIVYSPMGKQSGAHLNPAVTITFFWLGKVKPWDAVFYIAAQFLGASAGVLLLSLLAGHAFTEPPVRAIATRPGPMGVVLAFAVEAAMSFGLMLMVLTATNSTRLHRFTGLLVGALVATYITFLAPLSGMSMNPARSFASALPGQLFAQLWLYFVAPPVGMLLAAEVHRRIGGKVICAKLHHTPDKRCIFRCGYPGTRLA